MSFQEIRIKRPWVDPLKWVLVLGAVSVAVWANVSFLSRLEHSMADYQSVVAQKDREIRALQERVSVLQDELKALETTVKVKDQMIRNLASRRVISIPSGATLKVETNQ